MSRQPRPPPERSQLDHGIQAASLSCGNQRVTTGLLLAGATWRFCLSQLRRFDGFAPWRKSQPLKKEQYQRLLSVRWSHSELYEQFKTLKPDLPAPLHRCCELLIKGLELHGLSFVMPELKVNKARIFHPPNKQTFMGLPPQRQACGTATHRPEMNHINNVSITMRVERYPGQSTLCPLCVVCSGARKMVFPRTSHTRLGYTELLLSPHPSCRAETHGY